MLSVTPWEARQGCRQLLIPAPVFTFEVDEIGRYGQDIFILTYLFENLANRSRLVRLEKANEEIREIAEGPDDGDPEWVFRK